MWRYQRALPGRGMIGIFNRSYYEEMLVVRVHPSILEGQKLPPSQEGQGIWTRRFREVNDWEAYLSDQGYTIVKLFLNLSKQEQRKRFLARIDEPDKNWKFSAADVKERAYWDDYQAAFADVLSRSSTAVAPWYVIPADASGSPASPRPRIIANALIEMDPQFPTVSDEARDALLAARADLVAEDPDDAAAAGRSRTRGTRTPGDRGAAGASDRGAGGWGPHLHPGEDLRLLRLELLGRDDALVAQLRQPDEARRRSGRSGPPGQERQARAPVRRARGDGRGGRGRRRPARHLVLHLDVHHRGCGTPRAA